MKRFLIYSLLAVALFSGVAVTTLSGNENGRPETKPTVHHKTAPDQQQGSFSAVNLFLATGVGNEQIRLSHSFQHVCFRLLNPFSDSFRINHSTQQERRLFFAGNAGFLLKSAHKQLDGYYLYYLRKLLI
ncbi:MAG: hypothetical protein Q8904_10020 [Bacteroidota bacterium]|nr:hypothetical protein [Bacteroidota bacterium]